MMAFDWVRRCARALAGGALVLALESVAPGWAQSVAPPPAATAPETGDAAADDLRSLVAPVVLYPDPLLALVLQGTVFPLEIVQAERFLARRDQDPTLTPPPDWDQSVLGLLSFPTVLQAMSEHLEWTQALGEAVTGDLESVQAAIHELRWGAVSSGLLTSDERQEVRTRDDVVSIMPRSRETLVIPSYDPLALLAAVEPAADVPPDEAVAAAPVSTPVDDPPAEPTEPGTTAEALPPVEPAPAGPAASDEPPTAVTETAPAPGAAQPAYAPAYTAPAAPVPVTYAQPASSFWSGAATFTGGALMGGLLGYAIGDDDDDDDDWDFPDWDDDDDGGFRRNVNIEDSNIVIGNDRLRTNRSVTADLRQRRDRAGSPAGLGARQGRVAALDTVGRRPIGVAPAARERTAVRRAAPAMQRVELPHARRDAAAAPRAAAARAAAPRRDVSRDGAAVAQVSDRREAARASDRGLRSRAAAPSRQTSASRVDRAPQRAAVQRGGSSGGLASIKNGASARRDADRGRASLGRAKGRRGRG